MSAELSWRFFWCPGCEAWAAVRNGAATEVRCCGLELVAVDFYKAHESKLRVMLGPVVRYLLDGCEPGTPRPLAVTTLVSPRGVIALTRAEWQDVASMAIADVIGRGTPNDVDPAAMAFVRRAVLEPLGTAHVELAAAVARLGELLRAAQEGRSS